MARAPVLLAWLAGFCVPLKVMNVDIAGMSLYANFLVALVVALRFAGSVVTWSVRWFRAPLAILALFWVWAMLNGAGVVPPTVTYAKLAFAFVTAASFGLLIVRAERALYIGLLSGVAVTVVYMVYQWISSVLFGFSLPFTSIASLGVGRGLSQRYGIPRVTGFTEEPSFVATMLVGATLSLIAYATRNHLPNFRRLSAGLGLFGLALCTSNNLFAVTLIIALGWLFVHRGRVGLLMIAYYAAAILVTPYVLTRDITYYSRFSAYDIFRSSPSLSQLIGRGLGSYPAYFSRQLVTFDGIEVPSIASVWGGFLFDGGVVLAGLVVYWLSRVVRRTFWPEGLALLAVLLMLSNYNSPWWPLVSLALAQCLIRLRKDDPWTTTSISAATRPESAGTPAVSL